MGININILVISIVGFLLLSTGGFLYYSNSKSSANVATPAVFGDEHESVQTETTPTPKEASERALRAVAFIIASASEQEKKELIQRYGATDIFDATRVIALLLDENPEKLALIEAEIEKYNRQSGSGSTSINEVPQVGISANNLNDSDYCQQAIQSYNECMQEYNTKLAEYSACVGELSDPTNLKHQAYGRYAYSTCTKPTNICFKPFCN